MIREETIVPNKVDLNPDHEWKGTDSRILVTGVEHSDDIKIVVGTEANPSNEVGRWSRHNLDDLLDELRRGRVEHPDKTLVVNAEPVRAKLRELGHLEPDWKRLGRWVVGSPQGESPRDRVPTDISGRYDDLDEARAVLGSGEVVYDARNEEWVKATAPARIACILSDLRGQSADGAALEASKVAPEGVVLEADGDEVVFDDEHGQTWRLREHVGMWSLEREE